MGKTKNLKNGNLKLKPVISSFIVIVDESVE